jgi:hypothetical protein
MSRGRSVDPYGRTGACDFVNAPKTMADKIQTERVRLQRDIPPQSDRESVDDEFRFPFNFPCRFTSEPPASTRLICSWHSPTNLTLSQLRTRHLKPIHSDIQLVHTTRYSIDLSGCYNDQILNWLVRTYVPLRKLGLKTGIRCMECQAFGKPNSRPEGEANYPWSCRNSNLGRQILYQLRY